MYALWAVLQRKLDWHLHKVGLSPSGSHVIAYGQRPGSRWDLSHPVLPGRYPQRGQAATKKKVSNGLKIPTDAGILLSWVFLIRCKYLRFFCTDLILATPRQFSTCLKTGVESYSNFARLAARSNGACNHGRLKSNLLFAHLGVLTRAVALWDCGTFGLPIQQLTLHQWSFLAGRSRCENNPKCAAPAVR